MVRYVGKIVGELGRLVCCVVCHGVDGGRKDGFSAGDMNVASGMVCVV